VLVSEKRDLAATRRFFTRALEHGIRPSEVTTDRAPVYRECSMSCYPPRAMSWSSMRRMKLSTHLHSCEVGFVLGLIPFARRQRFNTSVRSWGQGGAPGWTNDLMGM
jgi:hypothetical protein